MKKILTAIVVVIMTLAMALPALACEVRLDGSTYYQDETYYLEGEDKELSDLCEVYAGNPDVAIMANEEGTQGACYTGGAYTDSGEPDDFIGEDEFDELCESIGVYPEGISGIGIDENDGTMWCQPYDINIEDIPAIPHGGDPTPQREWANEKIWEAGE